MPGKRQEKRQEGKQEKPRHIKEYKGKKQEQKQETKLENPLLYPCLLPLFWNVIILSKSVKNLYTNEEEAGKSRECYYSLEENGKRVKKGLNAGGRRE